MKIPQRVIETLRDWATPGHFNFSQEKAKELLDLLLPLSVPSTEVEDFLAEVRAEITRARKKHPNTLVTTLGLCEEAGEVVKAVLDENPEKIRKEAVQTAAMAGRVVIDGDQSVIGWRVSHGLSADIRVREIG